MKKRVVIGVVIAGYVITFFFGFYIGHDRGWLLAEKMTISQIRLEIIDELGRGGKFMIQGIEGIEFYPRQSAKGKAQSDVNSPFTFHHSRVPVGYQIAGAGHEGTSR